MGSSLEVGQTLVGQTGTPYLLQKVLYDRDEGKIRRTVWLALSDNKPYVIKPLLAPWYHKAFQLLSDLGPTPFVRLPVDGIEANHALVLQHYTEDFLNFMQSGPASRSQVKRILLDVLKGIAACHSKDWVHFDIKPSNIMISYTTKPDGVREICSVSLIDTEEAAKVKKGEAAWFQVGNVLWRSPEAQAGVRVAKPSDIWSFGVTAVYGITKLVLFAYEKLPEGVVPEAVVISNMLSFFGPLRRSLGLLNHIQDTPWSQIFITLEEDFGVNYPRKPFHLWQGIESDDKDFFLRALKLDPALRPSAEELLNDPWFQSP